MNRRADFPTWFARVLAGNKVELGEALTIAEAGGVNAERLLEKLHPSTGRAQVVGVTGPPGSGKSTLVNALSLEFARRERRVGVLAIDPSSPFTGGALLGDRVRMARASGNESIFIRSAATRGSLGGLSRAALDLIRVMDAAGYDPIIVETVGIGQSEVDIWRVAHTPVVIEAPGLGDTIQAMKAGVLEIASILCINKADLPGADEKLNQLREVARSASQHTPGWEIPVLGLVAQTGGGVAELANQIDSHRTYLEQTDRKQVVEEERARSEIQAVLQSVLVERVLERAARAGKLPELVSAVVSRSLTPREAARALRDQFLTLSDE